MGFRLTWRVQKRARELFDDDRSVQDIEISKKRGQKPLAAVYCDQIESTFRDTENVEPGMNRPVKKVKDVDGLPENALVMRHSMTRIINHGFAVVVQVRGVVVSGTARARLAVFSSSFFLPFLSLSFFLYFEQNQRNVFTRSLSHY